MFDIGGMELLVIGAVALIVVGPKELPRLVRSVGQWVGRAKSLARDFQSGMEDAARQADLHADVANLKNLSADIERDFKGAGENARRAIEDSGTKSRWTPPKRVAVSDPKSRTDWISEAQSTSCFLNWRHTKARISRRSGTCCS